MNGIICLLFTANTLYSNTKKLSIHVYAPICSLFYTSHKSFIERAPCMQLQSSINFVPWRIMERSPNVSFHLLGNLQRG